MSVLTEIDFFDSVNLNTNSFASVVKRYKLYWYRLTRKIIWSVWK